MIDKELQDRVIAVLRTVYDPEIRINIYELGLIYEIKAEETGSVFIRMTLTTPNCPAAARLPGEVESKVRAIPGVTGVDLKLTFDPPWNKSMLSEAVKLSLGIDDFVPSGRIRQ